jgi:Protein of unknown function (DUF3619)
MKNSPNTSSTTDMDLWGRNLAAQLNVGSQDLGHDIGERLRVARQMALKCRPMPQHLMRHSLAVQANGSLSGPPDEGLNLWRILASALPLLALVSGLMFLQTVQDEMAESDIASLDSALLLDELPPGAYTDPGFVQFIKLQQDARHD